MEIINYYKSQIKYSINNYYDPKLSPLIIIYPVILLFISNTLIITSYFFNFYPLKYTFILSTFIISYLLLILSYQ